MKNYDGKTPLPDQKQELFCELYTTSFSPFFGHGQNCYAFVYGIQKKIDDLNVKIIGADTRFGRGENRKVLSEYAAYSKKVQSMKNVCRATSSRLLTNVNIRKRIDHFVDLQIDDKIFDREAMRVVQQNFDLDVKMRAIERFDKIRGRIVAKVDLKHEFTPIESVKYVRPEKAA